MASLKKVKFYKNRYFITIFIFIVWLGIIDENNIIQRIEMHKENKKLREIKQEYLKKIQETHEAMKAMDDTVYLEKLAREKYMMKKENEELYIVTEK